MILLFEMQLMQLTPAVRPVIYRHAVLLRCQIMSLKRDDIDKSIAFQFRFKIGHGNEEIRVKCSVDCSCSSAIKSQSVNEVNSMRVFVDQYVSLYQAVDAVSRRCVLTEYIVDAAAFGQCLYSATAAAYASSSSVHRSISVLPVE
jgi:hypothetical protein